MTHTISILVRADVDSESITLEVTGCLTPRTRDVLAAQIEKARSLGPRGPVVVDARGARHVDPIALQLLRSTADTTGALSTQWDHPAPVRFLLATPLPHCASGDPAGASTT
ncbi:hypothetical protein DEO23_05480 [Brachybacterium endophyticum]|uniref:STAS domain-containing protein n=1 Tax=Brachybacterium endophyticum TaxID=2182385 RepID=A0A2U2RKM8_9MICO|nr:hypothetical protein [Brachybacterium endophyticum]PWH06423.1 hypothetical protein DEO23_05480 [Brachybacterium endophyticum]